MSDLQKIPPRMKLMAEYGIGGLWDHEGIGTCLDSYFEMTPEISKLQEDIYSWNDEYDIGTWHDKSSPEFDWIHFHQRGIELALRVKRLVGAECHVVYFKINDYPWDLPLEVIDIEL